MRRKLNGCNSWRFIALEGKDPNVFDRGERARELQLKHWKDHKGLLSCEDAIHLCTASLAGCGRFITMDKGNGDKNKLSPLGSKAILEPELQLRIIEPIECRSIQPTLEY